MTESYLPLFFVNVSQGDTLVQNLEIGGRLGQVVFFLNIYPSLRERSGDRGVRRGERCHSFLSFFFLFFSFFFFFDSRTSGEIGTNYTMSVKANLLASDGTGIPFKYV